MYSVACMCQQRCSLSVPPAGTVWALTRRATPTSALPPLHRHVATGHPSGAPRLSWRRWCGFPRRMCMQHMHSAARHAVMLRLATRGRGCLARYAAAEMLLSDGSTITYVETGAPLWRSHNRLRDNGEARLRTSMHGGAQPTQSTAEWRQQIGDSGICSLRRYWQGGGRVTAGGDGTMASCPAACFGGALLSVWRGGCVDAMMLVSERAVVSTPPQCVLLCRTLSPFCR